MKKRKGNVELRKQIRHAKKVRRRKNWLAARNYQRNKLKKHKYKSPKLKYTPPKRETVKVPIDFSLLSNKEAVLEFFNFCKLLNKKDCQVVHFSFDEVENIGSGSMTILLSICGWLNDQKISVSGSYPKNDAARDFLERSGFLRYFRAKIKKQNQDSNNAILERGLDQTAARTTAKQVRLSMKTVWGEEFRNTKLQGMLIELMANTVNHAYKQHKYQKGWYFSITHEPEKNVVKFCFVDNGRGILNTIKIRFQDTFAKVFGDLDDALILEQAFDGKFGSRTRLSYRGRGLPVIRKNHSQSIIKNLKVISNNVFLDFETGEAHILKENFEGTFYYWELDKTCISWNLK